MSFLEGLRASWRAAWRERCFRRQALAWLPTLVGAVALYAWFMRYNETRAGAPFADPVFAILPARDVSWLTFLLMYSVSVSGFVRLLGQPRKLLIGVQMYTLIAGARVVSMYLFPLEPAPTMIRIRDPFVQFVVGIRYGLERDLFFSGHVATAFMFVLLMEGRWWRASFLAGTLGVAFCLVWQHVHYTIDVLAAPLVTYVLYRLVMAFHSRQGACLNTGPAPPPR